MANTREILGRIKSVQNIQQITRAMKMIASARIKKVEKQLKARKPYCEKLREIMEEALGRLEDSANPLTEKRRVKMVGLLVITGDKGLCGPYNMNVIRAADRFIRNLEKGKKVVMYLAGNKAFRYFTRKHRDIRRSFLQWDAKDELAGEIAGFLTGEFNEKHFDELHCVYTQSISLMTQRVVCEKLLPLERQESKTLPSPYLFEPEPAEAINIILPLYLREYLMKILLDARTAEMASRLNAMSNATDNAEKLVGELRLSYFRARQENITTEILEITSGAESLKSG